MSNWINNLRTWQRIAIAAFFGNFGIAATVLPFYFTGKILAEGETAEWSQVHTIFVLAGLLSIAISLKLTRLDKLFNIGAGFLARFSGKQAQKKKGGTDDTL